MEGSHEGREREREMTDIDDDDDHPSQDHLLMTDPEIE